MHLFSFAPLFYSSLHIFTTIGVLYICRMHIPKGKGLGGVLKMCGYVRVYHNTDTVGTTSNCPYYRGVPTSEVSGIFPVGVAMCTRAVIIL